MAANIRELLTELNEAQSRVAKAASLEEKGNAVGALEKMVDKIQKIYPQLNPIQQKACDLQMHQGGSAHRYQAQTNQFIPEKPVVTADKSLGVGFEQFKKQARDSSKQAILSTPIENQEQVTQKPTDPKQGSK